MFAAFKHVCDFDQWCEREAGDWLQKHKSKRKREILILFQDDAAATASEM